MQLLSVVLNIELHLTEVLFLERNYDDPGTKHPLGEIRYEVSKGFLKKA